MIDVRTILLPPLLKPEDVAGRAVVVFDVLRATTTITNALHHGAKEIRVFESLDIARDAARGFAGPKLLAGEEACLPPEGFDLGNSPGDFTRRRVEGRTIFMCTTNGTRALLSASRAARLFAGALVNARAIAATLRQIQLPATLLCAGTDGRFALEDCVGCGAVLNELADCMGSKDDASTVARDTFAWYKNPHIPLELSQGGRNVINAGLAADIAFAGSLNAVVTVAECDPATMTLRPFR